MRTFNRHFIFLAILCFASFGFITPAFSAPPNLWWNHYKPHQTSQSSCVDKAEIALKQTVSEIGSDQYGRYQTDSDSVRFRNRNSQVVIECLEVSGQIRVFVLVSSNSIKFGNDAYTALEKRFKTN